MKLKNLLDFRKQYYSQINFYIDTICNIQCPYCYARKNLDWNKIIKYDQIKKIIPMLNKLDKSIISLIGGEPTLHPDFLNIIKLLSKTKHDIHVYTNGIKLDKLLNQKILSPKITISIHNEAINSGYKNIIFNNLIKLKKNNFDFLITFVFFNCNDKEYIDFFYELKKEFLKNIIVTPVHDYFKNDKEIKYFEKFELFKKENPEIFFATQKNINKKNKNCWYNEIDLKYNYLKKYFSFYLNNCFLAKNQKNLSTESNSLILNNKNIDLIKKLSRNKNIKCSKNCPIDYAFYGSVE